MLLLVTGLYAGQNTQKFNTGSVSIHMDDSYIFVYDRLKLSIRAQDSASMQEDLQFKLCSKNEYKKLINGGIVFTFIYMYSDGTIANRVKRCY